MANTINWGKIYCNMVDNGAWGADTDYTTEFVPDVSAPSCWTLIPVFSADSTQQSADTTLFTADATQIV